MIDAIVRLSKQVMAMFRETKPPDNVLDIISNDAWGDITVN